MIDVNHGRASVQFSEAFDDEVGVVGEFAAPALLAYVMNEKLVFRDRD